MSIHSNTTVIHLSTCILARTITISISLQELITHVEMHDSLGSFQYVMMVSQYNDDDDDDDDNDDDDTLFKFEQLGLVRPLAKNLQ